MIHGRGKRELSHQSPRRIAPFAIGKVPEYNFPTETPTKNCEQDVPMCQKCLREWIAFQLGNETLDRIACPECQKIIQKVIVEAHGSGETFKVNSMRSYLFEVTATGSS